MKDQRRILGVTKHSSIGVLYLLIIFSMFNFSLPVILGMLLGGLVSVLNFQVLCKSVEKALTPPHELQMGPALVKHYISFGISVVIISLSIIFHWVHPLGLVAGVSVIVMGFFIATFVEIMRILFWRKGR